MLEIKQSALEPPASELGPVMARRGKQALQGAKASPCPHLQLSRSEAKLQATRGPVGRRGAEPYLSSLPCPHPWVSIFVKCKMSGIC